MPSSEPEDRTTTNCSAADASVILAAAKASGQPLPQELKDQRGARWIGSDLSGLDLSGFDFSGADLSRANLPGCRLLGSRFVAAKLFQANLEDAECLSADFRAADLSECRAPRAGFGAADLTSARLFRSELSGTTFTQSKLGGADLRGATLRGARMREVDLRGADLSRADLSNADLDRSAVDGAQFLDTDLHDSRLRGLSGYGKAAWIEANITGVDFCGAYMVRRTIMDQNYLHEFRNYSKLNAALYRVWWITSDCGRSFVRWGLWTVFLAVVFAGIYEWVAIDYGDYPTIVSSLYYSVVTLTTLGYGDVLPASSTAQLLCMLEVSLGYVMLGGLLSIFSNKMARRAD